MQSDYMKEDRLAKFPTLSERRIKQEDTLSRLELAVGRGQARLDAYNAFVKLPLAVQTVIEYGSDAGEMTELDLTVGLTLYLRDNNEDTPYQFIKEAVDAGQLVRKGEGKKTRYALADDRKLYDIQGVIKNEIRF